MNFGTARIVVIVALLAVGIAVLFNGFSGSGASSASPEPSGATSTSDTDSPPQETTTTPPPSQTPSPQIDGVPVAVFNGTTVTGLGAQVQVFLEGKGYRVAQEAADAPTKPVTETAVYFRGGQDAAQNESDATHMAKRFFDRAKVSELGPEFDDSAILVKSAQVVVVVGSDYAAANAAA